MHRALSLLLVAFSVRLAAQAPYLVKDINMTQTADVRSSMPASFVRFGSRVYFVAGTSGFGVELWRTDGTAAGTSMVADIRSGALSSSPSNFVVLNNLLLFNARDTLTGEELWSTDGTAAGTRQVLDINTGSASSSPTPGVVYHGQLIFAADDAPHGHELWITDGTTAGTHLLIDLTPGAAGTGMFRPVVLNDRVYFATGDALWKTDGTANGTEKIKSLSVRSAPTVAGSRLFFNAAPTGTSSVMELWVSDGTDSGTQAVTDVRATFGVITTAPQAFGNRVLFVAGVGTTGAEVWISDGTTAGTHILRDIAPGGAGSEGLAFSGSAIFPMAVVGNIAYFTADDLTHHRELWKTDGTEAGTVMVRDITSGSQDSVIESLTEMNGKLFFVLSTSTTPRRLWVSDGTEAGTHPVTTSDPQPVIGTSSDTFNQTAFITNAGGTLYFPAAGPSTGFEPWKSDGTDGGTALVANLAVDPVPSSIPDNLIAADDQLFFEAWDGLGTVNPNNNAGGPRSLWRSDGTPEGTVKLLGTTSSGFKAVGRSLYFANSGKLWTSDGTPEGTVEATSFAQRFPSPPTILYTSGDKILVSTGSNVFDSKLWVTTTAPNAPAIALPSPAGGGFVELGGRVYYFVDNGTAFWTTDFTPAGTYAVIPKFEAGPLSAAPVAMGGHIYFVMHGSGAARLWRSDGTYDGTVIVKAFSSALTLFLGAEHKLFIVVDNQLWCYDGTETRSVVKLASSFSTPLALIGDRVVFPYTDSTQDREPWISDGTPEGTLPLCDIFPGVGSSFSTNYRSVDGVVYFQAFDDVHGAELWSTDGTPEGTKLVADIDPVGSSSPAQLVRAGSHLFFTATTGANGTELWALPLTSSARLSVNDTRAAEGDSGTATARFTVTLSQPAAQSVTVEYATSDGTATAGADYDAASGTLTFAPGETSKTVDVRVRGDATTEPNETFHLNLRNAAGAGLARSYGSAVIEDDDQFADLSLKSSFARFNNGWVDVTASNGGPLTATNIKIARTSTPPTDLCDTCISLVQLAPGTTTPNPIWTFSGGFSVQQFVTVTATSRERDQQPANNAIGWMSGNNMAMDALYLNPGQTANIYFRWFSALPNLSVASSDPAVLSVPTATSLPSSDQFATFVARAEGVGTATIRIYRPPNDTFGQLTVQVVAPGTKVRYPGAVTVISGTELPFDVKYFIRLQKGGTTPFSGELATGVVTVTTKNGEMARVTLPLSNFEQEISFYLPDVGPNDVTVSYSGDANFLPETITKTVNVVQGSATLLATGELTKANATVHVRVTGSQMKAPTGTVAVFEGSRVLTTGFPITASATAGVAQADISITGLSAAIHTLTVVYSGDARYKTTQQNVRIGNNHGRAVRH